MRVSFRPAIALVAIGALGWILPSADLLFPRATSAQPGPEEAALSWLRAAATAPRRVSYSGVKLITVWAGAVRASQVHVYHRAPDRTRLEYSAAGDQPARIVVIAGRIQEEYIPSRRLFIRRTAAAKGEDGLAGILPQIVANYDVRFSATETVAGRQARVIELQGKSPGRPRVRLWVDSRTRLILRFERYGPNGALQEAWAFLSLRVNPPLSPDLFVLIPPPGVRVEERRAAGWLSVEEVGRKVGFAPRLPAYLPGGYQFLRARVFTIRGTPTAALVFSDGVSTLSLFESRTLQGPPPHGRQVRVGAVEGTITTRGSTAVLHWNAAGISFTLVGELAEDELVRIGSSIAPSSAPGENPGGRKGPAAPAGMPQAEAAAAPPLPSVPVSPYITNNTHPLGPGLRREEEVVWRALEARGLAPIVVKVTVASDGVTHLPDGRLARLAWVWFVYGMTWEGGREEIRREVEESARALSVAVLEADARVTRVALTGYFHRSGRFDGARTDVTFTALLSRDRLLAQPAGAPAGDALRASGDVWYSPSLLAGTLVVHPPRPHDPHLPPGVRPAGVLPGERIVESFERFRGNALQYVLETKDKLTGLLFGIETRGRLWRGNPRRREIALTFDDGPSPLTTPLLLAVLRRYRVPATFFVIGVHAQAYPYLVRQMVLQGDEVGDHSFHHPNLATLDPGTAGREIAEAASVIRAETGRPPRWFRPPGGDYTVEVADAARRAGMGLAMWTDNAGDWALPPAKRVVERVVAHAEPGAIVLLHNGTLNTVRALPRIIVELRRRGYRFVTLSEMAQHAG
jgi:peptidoglycan/xylan/chitin deacetylase (PgdA/CDA1 family)/negative regulator of sigma E activity